MGRVGAHSPGSWDGVSCGSGWAPVFSYSSIPGLWLGLLLSPSQWSVGTWDGYCNSILLVSLLHCMSVFRQRLLHCSLGLKPEQLLLTVLPDYKSVIDITYPKGRLERS